MSRENKNAILSMWTIYGKTADFPQHFVARKWNVGVKSQTPTAHIILELDVEILRQHMLSKGLTLIPRFETDHPSIIEVWL